ncbi:hypothetical protein G3435_17965 [Pseudomonas sp. MAFF212428]|uniref:Secreted protein n=1 Tax=Pseudomonas brassicae TaxID=2708063 RepID=A0A6B3NYM1_9PSED|nr:hypothetical protein [Pseudomonas brassicae]NER61339.1 hypothetical protein [Pseudomonas brassicae]NER64727.1 hypothetical protein [Pseudomonas brassicae]
MKRTAITGLLLSAALLASPVFAAEDLCASNLQKIDDNRVSNGSNAEGMDDAVSKSVQEAKMAQAAGDKEKCIAITSKVLVDQDKSTKGDSGASGS